MKKSSANPPEHSIAGNFPPDLNFLLALHMLIHSARIHRDNNRILLTAADRFIAAMRHFLREDDEITLIASDSRFYLQQNKLVARAKAAGMVHSMLDFFSRRKLGGLRFFPPAMEAPPEEIALFARLLDQSVNHPEPVSWFENELREIKLSWLKPLPISDTIISDIAGRTGKASDRGQEEDGEKKTPVTPTAREVDIRRKALQTYGFAIHSLQEIADKVCANRPASIKKAMRMIHGMIDLVFEDSNVFLGLSTIRDYDDYTFTHSINVSILSMCLGHRIGLSKKSLETLSLSAMFHDLGKIDVPKEILNKPGKLNESEFKEMKNHSLYSVRRIILLKTAPQKKAEMLLPPFEHHLKYNLSGYPQTPRKKPLSLFGRIIAIADVFDAITAPRIYRPFAISPDRALSIMQEGSGTDFDPILLKFFINMVGIYPIGTLLRFDDEELGLVARYSGTKDGNTDLWVQLLNPDKEGKFSKGDLINLGPLDAASGTFNRPIKESLHSTLYNIQPAEYLL